VRQALINESAPGASTLPVANPSTRVLALGPAEEKALGLITSTGFGDDYDGYVVFSDVISMSYTPNAAPSPFSSYYFVGVVEHEISEIMGRTSWLEDVPGFTNNVSLMDYFRYAAAGVRQFTWATGTAMQATTLSTMPASTA
jgi:hypothetical protein